MIPKKIHYCWFGGNPLPDDIKRYIDSWKKYCPDYEIVEWNEKNFDIKRVNYVEQAYNAKKWAFITDYVRLYVLYNYGGIYMDTDVEVLKPLDQLLSLKGFSGFENDTSIPTGIMAAEKGLPLIKNLMNEYDNANFIKENGDLDLTTNVTRITSYFKSRGFKWNNSKQIIEDFTIFPKDYFCPKDYRTLELVITKNTYTIHHFASSWITNKSKVNKLIKKLLGPQNCKILLKIIGR